MRVRSISSSVLATLFLGSLSVSGPAAAAEYNWSTWYLTGTLGYGWRAQNSYPPAAYYTALGANFAAGAGYGGTTGASGPTKTDGLTFSVGFGYNYQFQWFVAGLDYEFIYADIANKPVLGQTSFANGSGPLATQYTALNFDTADGDANKWYGVLRARGGPAFGRFFPYVTGGVAYRLSYASSDPIVITYTYTGPGQYSASTMTYTGVNKSNAWGWVGGAGLEYAMTDSLLVKGEWLHFDFGSDAYLDPVATALTGAIVTRAFRRSADLVRLGLSYRFSWGMGGSSGY